MKRKVSHIRKESELSVVIDEMYRVIDEYDVTTTEIMEIGRRLIVSGYRQLVDDNPQCNSRILAEKISELVVSELHPVRSYAN